MFRRSSNRSGFTLIELLVVIAIIAILAAILFPVFAQARSKARQTACLAHSKQIASALAMYTQDYDEFLPAQNWKNTQVGFDIPNLLYPYTKNAAIWTCPAQKEYVNEPQDGNGNILTDRAWQNWIAGQTYLISTGVNTDLFPFSADGVTFFGGPGGAGRVAGLGDMKRPADTIAFFDSRWVGNGGYVNRIAGNIGIPGAKRHSNVVNFVFADGHAKGIPGTPYQNGGAGLNPPVGTIEAKAIQNGAINYRVTLDYTKYCWDPANAGCQ